MDYIQEALQRLLGVEEINIPLGIHTISHPGPIFQTVNTQNAHLPMRLVFDFGTDKMYIRLDDPYGKTLWLRHFVFTHDALPS